MLSSVQKSELKALLKPNSKVVITSHRSPDGDAIGSSLALANVLSQLNVNTTCVVPDRFPHFLNWMEGATSVLLYENDNSKIDELIAEADVVFSLDYNSLKRIGDLGNSPSLKGKTFVMIDHHHQPDDYAKYMISDVSASSTAQLVFEFIVDMGWENHLNIAAAECIYTGIVTDTGSFRFSSTGVNTHLIAAKLKELGLDTVKVHNAIYDDNSLNRLQLLGYCLSEKLVVLPELSAAYIALSKKELDKFNYQSGDTEGIVNYALSIGGVKVAAIIKENEENVRLSLRSKGSFSVNDVARAHFSGGGHTNAAGGVSTESLSETVQTFKSALEEYRDELSSNK